MNNTNTELLQLRNQELLEQNEKLKKCVEFYGRAGGFIGGDNELFVDADGYTYRRGGKLARETLEEIK